MKSLIALIFALFLPALSHAWVMPQVQFYVTPHYAQGQVNNPTPYPQNCQGYVYGQTQNGIPLNAWFAAQVPPYSFVYAYIYANPPYVLVNAWSEIYCR
ncbi:MAG: hypothetical protein HUU57_01145 [Bdellovibrio sp.]|nr:hypothetical protein [Bdellovibrio sp.]